MRLSENESIILSCVQLRADMTIEDILRATRLRPHVIRYSLKRLIERGIIAQIPYIDLATLGYTQHNLFFSLGSDSRTLRAAMIKELIATKEALWLAEMGADYEFGVELCARSTAELKKLLDRLAGKFGSGFYHKTVSSQLSMSLLPRGYFQRGNSFATAVKTPALHFEQTGIVQEIDSVDHQMLVALTNYPTLSYRALALKLGMPTSTFDVRVKKLREKGVLRGYYYAINLSTLGISYYKLLVYSKGINPGLGKRLEQFALLHPHIVHFIECFGSWDYELGVEVYHPQDIVPITQSIYESFGENIFQVKSLSKFRDLKISSYPG